ncbi:MAG: cob(I)yrinic acid a,c-diamide adenosyltransferase [Candidatus Liptonbacteria bacterium]|nr:cob(I)yrinic acid a,c-diamide adenosyltransferase [Candidatus Liptonbacteria bacterium]
MIIIFTGNGKGKTTAALGQAMRALGYNKRVLMIQFIKGSWISGEHILISKIKNQKLKLQIKNKKLPKGLESFYNFQIIKAGKGFIKIAGDKTLFSEHKKAAQKALFLAEKAIKSQKWDLIILDEINVAVHLKLLNEKKVLDILKCIYLYPHKPVTSLHRSALTVILTGRNAPKSFIKEADLVTEMKEIKHPFQKGCLAQKSIEY